LHEKLGIQKRFSAWWADQIERLNLKENYDYCTSRYTNANNQDFEDCIVSIDIAKHICMISGGEKAHSIREYFIQVERAWNSPEQVMARAIQIANKRIDGYLQTIKELTPAAEFGNAVSNNAGGILIRDYVKILENDGIRIGQDKLFSWLHLNGYIYRQKGHKPQWIPYKQYIEQELFRIKETPVSSPQYGDWISITMRVTGKGQKYFYEKLKATA